MNLRPSFADDSQCDFIMAMIRNPTLQAGIISKDIFTSKNQGRLMVSFTTLCLNDPSGVTSGVPA